MSKIPKSPDDPTGSNSLDRRSFLQQAGGTALGVGVLGLGKAGLARAAIDTKPQIKRMVPLGKTGLMVPDICAGGLGNAPLVRYIYDRGVTHFDTAEKFGAEPFVGKGLAGVRQKCTITTKYMMQATDDRHLIMTKLNGSLKRLRTDYIDIYMNHAVNDIARVKNPEWMEFVELAKKQGKIRFAGMSGHGGNLLQCLEHALENNMVDVILTAYNFGTDPAFYEKFTKHFDMIANQNGLPRLLKIAHDKGVGVMVMKTLMGGKINDLAMYEKDGADFAQAAFRWVHSSPYVDTLLISMKTKALADKYIAYSGDTSFEKADAGALRNYVQNHSGDYCRAGCNDCESSCPAGVPVSDVLRQRMYAESYGDVEMAKQGYDLLGEGASPCLTCTLPTCLSACSHGLDVPSLTRRTAKLLG